MPRPHNSIGLLPERHRVHFRDRTVLVEQAIFDMAGMPRQMSELRLSPAKHRPRHMMNAEACITANERAINVVS